MSYNVQQIQDKIANDDYSFDRKPEVQAAYDQDILIKQSRLWESLFNNDDQITMRRNEYPYNLTSNCDHYIIWSSYHIDQITAQQIAYNYLSVIKYKDFVVWKNPESKQSVENVCHYHLIVEFYE